VREAGAREHGDAGHERTRRRHDEAIAWVHDRRGGQDVAAAPHELDQRFSRLLVGRLGRVEDHLQETDPLAAISARANELGDAANGRWRRLADPEDDEEISRATHREVRVVHHDDRIHRSCPHVAQRLTALRGEASLDA
jgi:hypothetical protein